VRPSGPYLVALYTSIRGASSPAGGPQKSACRGIVGDVGRVLTRPPASQTLDVYSHLWPEDEDRTRTALEAALRAAVSPACHEAPGQKV